MLLILRRVVKRSRRSKDEAEWVKSDAAKESLTDSIREVLVELFDKHMEVPFIAAYRKRVRPCCLALLCVFLSRELSWTACTGLIFGQNAASSSDVMFGRLDAIHVMREFHDMDSVRKSSCCSKLMSCCARAKRICRKWPAARRKAGSGVTSKGGRALWR